MPDSGATLPCDLPLTGHIVPLVNELFGPCISFFNDMEILTGNMISDFVKGKRNFNIRPASWAGINLHRLIDNFTDEHAATRKPKSSYGHTTVYIAAHLWM